MNLSIFSSKNSIIFKSVLSFITFAVSYTAFIFFIRPAIITQQSQWQENLIAAQRFVYNSSNRNVPVIIVGSSLSARLKRDMLPQGYYSLAFQGGSVITGLEIIKRCSVHPRIILVEINLISREMDDKFLVSLFSPVLFRLRSYIPSFREEYQPVTVLLSYLKSGLKSAEERKAEGGNKKTIFASMLEKQKQQYDSLQKDRNMVETLRILEDYFNFLRSNGSTIVFFETPMHPEMSNSDGLRFLKGKLVEWFSGEGYSWFDRPDDRNYVTTDGLHMNRDSALRFMTLIQTMVSRNFNICTAE